MAKQISTLVENRGSAEDENRGSAEDGRQLHISGGSSNYSGNDAAGSAGACGSAAWCSSPNKRDQMLLLSSTSESTAAPTSHSARKLELVSVVEAQGLSVCFP